MQTNNKNLKISLNDFESISPNPNSARGQSRIGIGSSRNNESCRDKRNLKSCKSVKSVGSRRSYSSRLKREETRNYSTKNYRSARNNVNMYSNNLNSEPLSQMSMFSSLIGKHGPKKSIDKSVGFTAAHSR